MPYCLLGESPSGYLTVLKFCHGNTTLNGAYTHKREFEKGRFKGTITVETFPSEIAAQNYCRAENEGRING